MMEERIGNWKFRVGPKRAITGRDARRGEVDAAVGWRTRRQSAGAATVNGRSARDLAGKLRLTAIALGCPTAKELCRRFAVVNPDTAFVLQNAYKWIHGKARPRMSSVYDDWAGVLGQRLSPQFLASAGLDDFAAALGRHFFLPPDALAGLREGIADGVEAGLPADGWSRDQILSGLYLALSPAWSKTRQGELIAGCVAIGQGDADPLAVVYRENLFGRPLDMHGRFTVDGRSAQATLNCRTTGGLYMLALSVPAPPASVVGGMLCGTALHDPELRPSASRILLLRGHGLDRETLLDRSRYLKAERATIAGEIASLGYGGGDAARGACAANVLAFLAGEAVNGVIDAPSGALARLALALDGFIDA